MCEFVLLSTCHPTSSELSSAGFSDVTGGRERTRLFVTSEFLDTLYYVFHRYRISGTMLADSKVTRGKPTWIFHSPALTVLLNSMRTGVQVATYFLRH